MSDYLPMDSSDRQLSEVSTLNWLYILYSISYLFLKQVKMYVGLF